MYIMYFKRVIDLFVSIVAFVVLSPIFVAVGLFIFITQHESPFFIQVRPGRYGRPFKLIKFKTMNDGRDEAGRLLPDEQRLTRIGAFIRKTSLDEIPQLLNVIAGSMSLIGPRPLLIEYLNLYTTEQRRRQNVRPGITGWAQIKGRNAISWTEKFQHDLFYVDNLSFALDSKIFFITIWKVFRAEGISGRGVATAQKFNGNN